MTDDLYITRLDNTLQKDNWNEAEALYALVNIRSILERYRLKPQYPILNLYCNWAVHTSIEESSRALAILRHITAAMVDYRTGNYTESRFSAAVIEGISMHIFFTELVSLGKQLDIPGCARFDDQQACALFAAQMILNLIGKPVLITQEAIARRKHIEKTAKEIYRLGMTTGDPERFSVVGFSFVIYQNKIHWRLFTKYSSIHKINLVGKFVLTTQAEVDKMRKRYDAVRPTVGID